MQPPDHSEHDGSARRGRSRRPHRGGRARRCARVCPMATMTAFQLVEWGQPAEFREVEVPRPGAGEVLVKVAGVGLCHTDVHFLAPESNFGYATPFTLGHETGGWVEELGPGTDWVRARRPGRRGRDPLVRSLLLLRAWPRQLLPERLHRPRLRARRRSRAVRRRARTRADQAHRPRSGPGRAAHRRRGHVVPRGEEGAPEALARSGRGRHRCRRARWLRGAVPAPLQRART